MSDCKYGVSTQWWVQKADSGWAVKIHDGDSCTVTVMPTKEQAFQKMLDCVEPGHFWIESEVGPVVTRCCVEKDGRYSHLPWKGTATLLTQWGPIENYRHTETREEAIGIVRSVAGILQKNSDSLLRAFADASSE